MISIILTLFLLWNNEATKNNLDKPEQVKTSIITESFLETGWYYVVHTDNGFQRQLDKSSLLYFIDPTPIVTSKNVVKYEIYTSIYGDIGLSMQLDSSGTITWANATERATDKEVAFIVDNKLMQVATVVSRIPGGSTALNRGDYTKEELIEIQSLIEK